MASRKEQKEAARQRRLAEEEAARSQSARTRRLQLLGGVIVAAVVIVVVLVVVSGHGAKKHPTVDASQPQSTAAKSTAAKVNSLLAGIPQSGNVLGDPRAKVTLTEFGDLQCPICMEFATSTEEQLIANQVKQGQLKIVYRSYETASGDPNASKNAFPTQQAAAYAAGAQKKAWNFILLFYNEQGTENTPYVTTAFLTGLAKQIDGLNVSAWNNDRFNPKYTDQVQSDATAARTLNLQGTPSLSFSGPKSQTQYIDGDISYATAEKAIREVS